MGFPGSGSTPAGSRPRKKIDPDPDGVMTPEIILDPGSGGVMTPETIFDPGPGGGMTPENIFDPGPSGVMTPEIFFDPDPDGVMTHFILPWPRASQGPVQIFRTRFSGIAFLGGVGNIVG